LGLSTQGIKRVDGTEAINRSGNVSDLVVGILLMHIRPAQMNRITKITTVALAAFALLFAGCIKTDQERALAGGAKPLTKQEAQDQFAGNTLVGSIPQYSMNFVVYYDADGRISGKVSGPYNDDARGTWRVTDEGQVCNDWSKETWRDGPACNTYYREGEEYKVFHDEGGVASVAKLEKGNSRKLEMRTDLEIAKLGGDLEQLTAEFLRKAVPGNTVSGELTALGDLKYHAFYGDDGKVAAKLPSADEDDKGTYRITEGGKVCVTWSRWHQRSHEVALGSPQALDPIGSSRERGRVLPDADPERGALSIGRHVVVPVLLGG
jgi:hypothetical protein